MQTMQDTEKQNYPGLIAFIRHSARKRGRL